MRIQRRKYLENLCDSYLCFLYYFYSHFSDEETEDPSLVIYLESEAEYFLFQRPQFLPIEKMSQNLFS